MEALTTRVFNNGNSQAVRIPAELRLTAERVSIWRNDLGELVIHPLPVERGTALLDALRAFSDSEDAFIAILHDEHATQPRMQERELL